MDPLPLVERAPTPQEFRHLRDAVGWDSMADDGLAAGLASSLYACVVEVDGEAVACGRVIGDGGMYFYVQDVIVMPGYGGQGLGSQIMDAVMGYLERAAKPGAFVGLMAAQNAEGFYERYGFRRRPDDRPGMFRVW